MNEIKRVEQLPDENRENKLYVGNLDLRVTEYHIIKIFKPFGKLLREEFLWHTHGPKRGEPRGYCFIEYSTKDEALKAKSQLNGKWVFGRPLVIRFVVNIRNDSKPIVNWKKPSENNNIDLKISAIKSKLNSIETKGLKEEASSLSVGGIYNVRRRNASFSSHKQRYQPYPK
eukprot:TRINITY_DN4676_c0_g1_i2.p1 TRINITY_DN4676_c0_g1~~TRINITY_DN4676_c0_g1_i2.p1  ORF type:complete len:172 (-),score=27.83 TRINITY_DN4676_c0_g1_i2:24-539(-)